MKITGIIAEYNPFHNGHLYQIRKCNEQGSDLIVAVISGSFTQRGEATVLDKWQRAAAAAASGCDLVLELPFAFACRSAQDFARGGIMLLTRLGIVNQLAFGAECTDLSLLKSIAQRLDEETFQKQLHPYIASGLSYAQAISQILSVAHYDCGELIKQPNNILAIEYLRSLRHINASLQPLLIPRQGADYHEETIRGPLASATAIRQSLYAGEKPTALKKVLPPSSLAMTQHLQPSQLPQMNRLYLPLKVKLLTSQRQQLQSIYGINEGLENRILRQAATADSWQALIQAVTTKRYPASRIARTLLYLLLGLKQESIARYDQSGPLYARLLAASPRGKAYLGEIKIHSCIPLISKTSQYLTTSKRCKEPNALTPLEQMLSLDTLATELRNLTCEKPSPRNDFQQSPLFSP
ncbi:MAG: nucleotidyltransferase [Selenomonas sp.]|uniref:nucleotidyltransferase n=1 Tax=Selenomonas sp. TaxID=2053611 RepID=UPI002600B71A|nr:nucleotidyltransferase [Selenomonas sp.]MCR5757925.1 nucleotidyltransferase [Selenomonas sp.]